MPAPIPIGDDIFRSLREKGLEYVDKTHFIAQLIDDVGTPVTLLPRPRRFGKTVNMTMLESYFSRSTEDLSHLFQGLHIWDAGPEYRDHFQRHPTIFMSFKNIKPQSETEWIEALTFKLRELFRIFDYLPDQAQLTPQERNDFESVLEQRANSAVLHESLLLLSAWLHRATGETVVILIDEYDTPIHAAWIAGCYAPVVNFFRAFFGAALKGNPHLYKGVLTGILRVSKESIFSDLNNLRVLTVLDSEMSDAFGFTEEEVRLLCERQGQLEHLPTLQSWYNGYRFGDRTMYNPWSVLNFLKNPDKQGRPYWITSSSNDLIRHLTSRHAMAVHDDFQTLLEGGGVARTIDPNLVFSELERRPDALFTLLLFSGYLKAERLPWDPSGPPETRLSIPNREVLTLYQTTFRDWLEDAFGASGGQTRRLTNAVLTGNEEQLETLLGHLAEGMLSMHDGAWFAPEALYHGLMLGLCAAMEPHYRVRSNRESGTGRPDLLILPTRPGQGGAVFELKVVSKRKKQTLNGVLADAISQLKARKYAAELEASGANPIQQWAVAFDGKRVRVALVGAK